MSVAAVSVFSEASVRSKPMGEGASMGRGGGGLGADPQAMRRELEEELRELENRLSRSTRSLEERLRNLGKMQDGIVVPPPLELVLPSASPLNKFANGHESSFSPLSSPISGLQTFSTGEAGEKDGDLEKYSVLGMEGSSHVQATRQSRRTAGGGLPTPSAVSTEGGEVPPHDDKKEAHRDDLSDFEDEEEEEEHDELAGDGPVGSVYGKREEREEKDERQLVSEEKERHSETQSVSRSAMGLPTNGGLVLPFGQQSTLPRDSEMEELEKRRREKEREYEQELRQLQARLRQKAEEKVELEQSRHRHAEELSLAQEETREARRASNELQKELLQLQKRLNHEMTLCNSKDEELQKMQRKFPAMLRELESLSSRNAALLKDKEDLMRRM